ncbi:MAG: nucleotidyltransferase family protein [Thermoanaerobaculia bacterium]
MIALELIAAARFAAGLASDSPGEELLAPLRWHGLVPLIAMRLAGASPAFERELRGAMAIEIARQRELAALLDDLAAAGVEPLILKGTALAYSHYATPWARPRGDVDLLIRRPEKEQALAVLVARGYELPNATSGEEVMNQRLAVKRDGAVGYHVDVHWRLSNAPGFADRFAYEALRAAAVRIEALGQNAWRPSDADCLIIACAHRVAHHRDEERLIWLCDIHLLATALDREGFAAMERRAREQGMWSVVVEGLEAARPIFETKLEGELRADEGEWSAAYLQRGRSTLGLLLVQLRQLPPGRALRLLKEHAFPPAVYMRAKYGAGPSDLLLWLYIRRLAGAFRKLRQPTR